MSPSGANSLTAATTFAEIQEAIATEVRAIPAYQALSAAYRSFDGDDPKDPNKGGEDYILANAPTVLSQLSNQADPAATGAAAQALQDRLREALAWATLPQANPLLTASGLDSLVQQITVVANKVQTMSQFALANAAVPGGPALADAQSLAYILQDADFLRLIEIYGTTTQYAQQMANMNVPTTPPPGGWG